jgi:hypothetical protein
MAIQITTDDPQGLLDSIYATIDEGKIKTWAYDDDKDFFHDTSDGQWVGEVWLRPAVFDGSLVLNVVPPKRAVTTEAYAVYHGRFIEMLLAHFDQDFSEASATAQATEDDQLE